MSNAQETSALKVACHCGANNFSIPVALPLDRSKYANIHICLCDVCRLQNGTLAGNFVHAPSPPFDPESPPASLTVYTSSSFAARYFCSTCSSQLFFRYSLPELTSGASGGFYIATGCLELPPGEKFGIDYVGFVKNTQDGGIASWLPGEKIARSFKQPYLTDEDIHALEATAVSQLDDPQHLEGHCHCEKVKIRLSRQTGKQEELPPHTFCSNTDLVIPDWTPEADKPPIDEKNPWWIRDALEPGKGKRFLGGLCTCFSCRTVAGVEIQSWLFVPTACVELTLASGETVPWPAREAFANDEKFKDIIGTYRSTPGDLGVLRGFCKTCGANVFWDGLNSATRRNLIDLSAGLLSVRGVREESWIEWWADRVSYVEESDGRHDIGRLVEKGLKEWKQRHGGRV
ncbi:hypothetical protein ABW20_dc0106783 [Dactylellina cionopaga]|nr:hypothetical protein ABW20_dc0106783 [Dactylellina cionopaga]